MPLTRVGNSSIRNVDEIYAISRRVRSKPATGTFFFTSQRKRTWYIRAEIPGSQVVIGEFDVEGQADECMANVIRQLGFLKLDEDFAVRPSYVHRIQVTEELGVGWNAEIIFNVDGAIAKWHLMGFDSYEPTEKYTVKVTDKINSALSSASRPVAEAAKEATEICTSDGPASSSLSD